MPVTSPNSCGSPDLSQEILDTLSVEADFDLPDLDLEGEDYQLPKELGNSLYEDVSDIEICDLTEKKIDGNGVFDVVMASLKVHLRDEYQQGRLTGADYVKVYVESSIAALSSSMTFLLSKDKAHYEAMMLQIQARAAEIAGVLARVQLAEAKVAYAIRVSEMKGVRADYAFKMMNLSLADADYCIKLAQKEMMEEQRLTQVQETAGKAYQVTQMMPAQRQLTIEQTNQSRAQTMGTRLDAVPVTGVMGKQVQLYEQQITSYKRDAETKVAEMFLKVFITNLTLDEEFPVPEALLGTEISEVFASLRANVSL